MANGNNWVLKWVVGIIGALFTACTLFLLAFLVNKVEAINTITTNNSSNIAVLYASYNTVIVGISEIKVDIKEIKTEIKALNK